MQAWPTVARQQTFDGCDNGLQQGTDGRRQAAAFDGSSGEDEHGFQQRLWAGAFDGGGVFQWQ